MNDVTGIIKSTGVALEQEAFRQFGAAVGGIASAALGSVFGQSQTDTGARPSDAGEVVAGLSGEERVSDTTKYAAALTEAFQTDFDPKLKFLFKVSFAFHPAVLDYLGKFGTNISTRAFEETLTFMVTQIDRPQVDFEYEDVNMYNFRTQVLTRIKHRELSMTLTDDVGNQVLDFANIYRMIYQPIARPATDIMPLNFDSLGMQFTEPFAGLDGGGMQSIPRGAGAWANQPLMRIRIAQIFVERGTWEADPAKWVKVVHFDFINPRITNINMDDLDYASGGGPSTISLSFNFDALHMSYAKTAALDNTSPVLDGRDILAAHSSYNSGTYRNSTTSPGGEGIFGQFARTAAEMIGNQGIRLAQTSLSNALNKALGGSAGGRIVAGELSRVGGGLAAQAQKALFGATRGFGGAGGGGVGGTGGKPAVSDSSTGGSSSGSFP